MHLDVNTNLIAVVPSDAQAPPPHQIKFHDYSSQQSRLRVEGGRAAAPKMFAHLTGQTSA